MPHRRIVAFAALFASALTFATIVPLVAQQQEAPQPGWVEIAVGENGAGLLPRPEPYLEGRPYVSFPIEPTGAVLANDGQPVASLKMIAWREGNGSRVMVFGLSEGGVDDSQRFLSSMLVEWNSTIDFAALAEMGIGDVVVTTGARPDR